MEIFRKSVYVCRRKNGGARVSFEVFVVVAAITVITHLFFAFEINGEVLRIYVFCNEFSTYKSKL